MLIELFHNLALVSIGRTNATVPHTNNLYAMHVNVPTKPCNNFVRIAELRGECTDSNKGNLITTYCFP